MFILGFREHKKIRREIPVYVSVTGHWSLTLLQSMNASQIWGMVQRLIWALGSAAHKPKTQQQEYRCRLRLEKPTQTACNHVLRKLVPIGPSEFCWILKKVTGTLESPREGNAWVAKKAVRAMWRHGARAGAVAGAELEPELKVEPRLSWNWNKSQAEKKPWKVGPVSIGGWPEISKWNRTHWEEPG